MGVADTDLATSVIAARAIAGSIVGIAGSGFLAGYFRANPVRGSIGWPVVAIFAVRIPLWLGPAGFGLLAARATHAFSAIVTYAASTISIVASLWLSLIAAQVVQNAAGRFFGAKPERLRFWAGDNVKRRRMSRR
jgi:hypothetical protein